MGANALGKSSLWNEIDFDLLVDDHAFEQLVFTHVGADHLAHLLVLQQQTDAVVVDAGVVAHHGEIFRTALGQRLDEILWNAAQSEATHEDAGTFGNQVHRFVCSHHARHTSTS